MTGSRPATPRSRVPLAPRTTLGVGGAAEHFVEAASEQDVRDALEWARDRKLPVWVLGGGSNVVIGDEGLGGLVVHVALRGIEARQAGDRVEVTASAGEPWDAFVGVCVERGWAGLECLSAIPGLVGATPVQNVGAYGQEVADTITRVRVVDRETLDVEELPAAACAFAYRDSLFKSERANRYVVLAVTYALRPGGAPAPRYPELQRRLAGSAEPASLADVRRAVIEIRTEKSMAAGQGGENARSCGSFFVNPVVEADLAARIGEPAMPSYPQVDGRVKLSAAWLIEQAGLRKGHRERRVGLSTKHALAIVCHDGATARDVVAFARDVVARVRDRFGVTLIPEPNLWGIDHEP